MFTLDDGGKKSSVLCSLICRPRYPVHCSGGFAYIGLRCVFLLFFSLGYTPSFRVRPGPTTGSAGHERRDGGQQYNYEAQNSAKDLCK